MAGRRGRISEIYDLAAIEAQQKQVMDLVGQFVKTVADVKPLAIKLEGAEKTKDIIDGVNKVNATMQQTAETSAKVVTAMNGVQDAVKKSSLSFDEQKKVLERYTGTLEQNSKLNAQYKLRLEEIARELREQKKGYEQGLVSITEYQLAIARLGQEQTELRVASAEVMKTIKAQVKEAQAAQGGYDQLNARLGLMRDLMRQLSDEEKNSPFGLQLASDVAELDKELKKQDASMGNFQRNVGNYSGSLTILEQAFVEVKTQLEKFNKDGGASADVIDRLEKEYASLGALLDRQVTGFTTMREEIKANQVAIEQLTATYGEDSEVVKKLIQQNAQLRDSYGDMVATQKTLGSDTFAFDAALQGGQALIGMYGAAEGAAALFGEENEDLQKSMVKLQAVMALVQGVQATVNALQAEGALIQGVMAARTTVTNALLKVQAFVLSGATRAAQAFNGALLMGGLTALLVLVPLAIQAMESFSDETDDAAEKQKKFNEELEATRQKLAKVAEEAEKQRNARSGGLNDLRRELQLLEASGASQDKVTAKKKQVLDKELFNLEVLRAQYINDAEKRVEVEEQVKDKKTQILALDLEAQKKASDESEKINKERAAKAQELRERELKAQFELLKLSAQQRIEASRGIFESEAEQLQTRLIAREEANREEALLIEAQRRFELEAAGLTASERLLINQKADAELVASRKKAAADIMAITQAARQQEAQQAMDNATAVQAGIEAAEQDAYMRRMFAIADIQEAESRAELERYKRGEISKEQYEANILGIENRAREASLRAELEYYNRLIMLADLPADAKEQALKRIREIEKQLNAESLADEKATADKKAAIQKAYQEKMRDSLVSLGNEVKGLVFDVLIGGVEQEKNAIQDSIDMLEKRKQKQIEDVNATLATEQQKADQIAVIESRASAQREQLEMRKRKLDQERARYERIRNIADIIQQTSIAVVGALKPDGVTPLPARVALAAVVGAIGAAQIARVLATPIPRYQFGIYGDRSHPGGPAIVGDGGKHEYVTTPDGQVYKTPDTDTLVNLPKGAQVFPDIMAFAKSTTGEQMARTLSLGDMRTGADAVQFQHMTSTLGKKLDQVAVAIKNIPQPNIEVKGITKQWVRSGYSWQEFVNRQP